MRFCQLKYKQRGFGFVDSCIVNCYNNTESIIKTGGNFMYSFKKRILSLLLATVTLFATFLPFSANSVFAASNVKISAVSNVSSGVKVKWNSDTSKTGYYVYRKSASSSKWTRVATVKQNNQNSWTDTNAVNGKKYDYKVQAYKGKKIYTNSTKKTIYRLSTPSITSLSYSYDSVRLKGSKNDSASGFQIKYSKKSDFSNSKTKTYSTTQLNKIITNLTCSAKYYFKIRAYKKSGDKYYYSGYSKTKNYTAKSSYTAYTKGLQTTFYTKPSTSSTKQNVGYMTKVRLYQDYSISSKGVWKKLKFNDKYYYAWAPKGQTVFSLTKESYEYDFDGCNQYQKEVVEFALNIFNEFETEYDSTKKYSNGEINPKTQKYPFDCSGLVKYVHNTVLSKYVPSYKIPWNIIELFNEDVVYNNDLDCEFKSKIICSGSLDYNKLQPGDVLFFNLKNGATQGKVCNHCGIYLGNKQFIHSSGSTKGVDISTISGSYKTDFVKAVRYIPSKIQLINKKVKPNVSYTLSVYPESNCKSGTQICKINKNKTVTVISTKDDSAYISFTDDNGNTQYGYAYKPKDKFPTLYK